jgi:tetratricopeptide (TPR) repeat protein
MLRLGKRGPWLATLALLCVLSGIVLSSRGSRLWSYPYAGYLGRGLDAYARGDWDAANRLARDRLRESKDDLAAIRLLARSSVRLGRYDQALSLYDRLGPDTMKVDDLYLLGIALTGTGNSRGVEVWERALQIDPDHPESLLAMIPVYLKHDQFKSATEAARRLAKHPKWQDRADGELCRIQIAQGDATAAIRYLKEHPNPPQADPAHISETPLPPKDLARALLRARQPTSAQSQLQTVLARGPDAEASWLLSRAYLQENALPEALDTLREAGSFSDEHPILSDPAPYMGAASCAECHRERYQMQSRSRHARTFHRASGLGDLIQSRSSLPDPNDAKVSHTLRKVGDRQEQETRTPEGVFSAVVDYAFGSGDRGKTLVAHDASGHMFELRLSLYHEGAQPVWDITSGHSAHPREPQVFLGEPLSDDGVRRCLLCHVTSPQAIIDATGPEAADGAIGCEKCHGPGGNHVLAIAAKFPDLAIARPSLASGSAVVKICAQCHSPRGMDVVPGDPASVRFQGTTLTWSRCYTESNDILDCVTCHDPHTNAMTSESYYEAKCLSCHGGGANARSRSSGTRKRRTDLTAPPQSATCPVNPKSGCITCHMPRVKDVIPHSMFTDHFIRVHRD